MDLQTELTGFSEDSDVLKITRRFLADWERAMVDLEKVCDVDEGRCFINVPRLSGWRFPRGAIICMSPSPAFVKTKCLISAGDQSVELARYIYIDNINP